ncbi:hypothetical protein HDU96_000283 [Phlyctochytrium bullatum]|nr:hypothetical protein HDU96_000283 [Phlyctochytrium bullatum]
MMMTVRSAPVSDGTVPTSAVGGTIARSNTAAGNPFSTFNNTTTTTHSGYPSSTAPPPYCPPQHHDSGVFPDDEPRASTTAYQYGAPSTTHHQQAYQQAYQHHHQQQQLQRAATAYSLPPTSVAAHPTFYTTSAAKSPVHPFGVAGGVDATSSSTIPQQGHVASRLRMFEQLMGTSATAHQQQQHGRPASAVGTNDMAWERAGAAATEWGHGAAAVFQTTPVPVPVPQPNHLHQQQRVTASAVAEYHQRQQAGRQQQQQQQQAMMAAALGYQQQQQQQQAQQREEEAAVAGRGYAAWTAVTNTTGTSSYEFPSSTRTNARKPVKDLGPISRFVAQHVLSLWSGSNGTPSSLADSPASAPASPTGGPFGYHHLASEGDGEAYRTFFADFATRVMRATSIEPPTAVASLLYMERLRRRALASPSPAFWWGLAGSALGKPRHSWTAGLDASGRSPQPSPPSGAQGPHGGAEHRVWVAGLMLADAYLNDNAFLCRSWAEVTGFTTQECVAMRKAFLTCIDHDLNLGEAQHEAMLRAFDAFEAGERERERERNAVARLPPGLPVWRASGAVGSPVKEEGGVDTVQQQQPPAWAAVASDATAAALGYSNPVASVPSQPEYAAPPPGVVASASAHFQRASSVLSPPPSPPPRLPEASLRERLGTATAMAVDADAGRGYVTGTASNPFLLARSQSLSHAGLQQQQHQQQQQQQLASAYRLSGNASARGMGYQSAAAATAAAQLSAALASLPSRPTSAGPAPPSRIVHHQRGSSLGNLAAYGAAAAAAAQGPIPGGGARSSPAMPTSPTGQASPRYYHHHRSSYPAAYPTPAAQSFSTPGANNNNNNLDRLLHVADVLQRHLPPTSSAALATVSTLSVATQPPSAGVHAAMVNPFTVPSSTTATTTPATTTSVPAMSPFAVMMSGWQQQELHQQQQQPGLLQPTPRRTSLQFAVGNNGASSGLANQQAVTSSSAAWSTRAAGTTEPTVVPGGGWRQSPSAPPPPAVSSRRMTFPLVVGAGAESTTMPATASAAGFGMAGDAGAAAAAYKRAAALATMTAATAGTVATGQQQHAYQQQYHEQQLQQHLPRRWSAVGPGSLGGVQGVKEAAAADHARAGLFRRWGGTVVVPSSR